MVVAEAATFVEWPGSLPESGEAHVLHYWARGKRLLEHLTSSRWWLCRPGHQYVVFDTRQKLLRQARQLVDEVRRLSEHAHVRAFGSTRALEPAAMATIGVRSSDDDEASLRRGITLIEDRIEVVVHGEIFSIECAVANAYRRLEAEMARESSGERGVLWKRSDAGPLLCLAGGERWHTEVESTGAGALVAEHAWDAKASRSRVLGEARSSAERERVLGAMDVDTGLIVMARAALSHHVLVPKAKDPLAAFRKLLKGGTSAELRLPKLGKVGGVIAIAPGAYEVLFGSTDSVRWWRVRAKHRKRSA